MRFRLPRISDAKDHILAAVLLVLASALMLGRYQGGIDNLRKVSITLFSYLEEPLSNIRVYRQALKTNAYLRKQNVLLQDEVSRLRAAGQRNEELRSLLNFQSESTLQMEPVRVVAKEINQINNFLTVDAGAEADIEVGMPMVAADGLVGKVILTSGSYAQVMPFYNSAFRVSARLLRSSQPGIVSWEGTSGIAMGELVLNYVPQTVPVDTGEVVVTSGFSNQFPADIPIGRVIRTEPLEGRETQRIYLRPYVDIRPLAEGFLVRFTPDTTISNLNEAYREMFE
ncbi:MAG: rod shape-determining protein MreC [Balneolaceae bacterium]|nr:rod shape-determining protein MreC [Balneolaceae bacterium]